MRRRVAGKVELLSSSCIAGAGLGFVVCLLWAPFGLRVGGIIEEWLILERFLRGVSPFELGHHLLRPLAYLHFYAGYAMSPGSFAGLNFLHLFYIWGKGISLYLVVREIGVRADFGFAAALMFVLYPADGGQMTLRTTAIQGHVMFFLLAVWLLLKLGKEFRVVRAGAMVASLTICLLTYEVAYPLAIVCPLLLLVGERRASRYAASVWFGTVLLLATSYVLTFLVVPTSYQATVLSGDLGNGSFWSMGRSAGAPYAHTLWYGWQTALASFRQGPGGDLFLAGLAGLSSVLAIFVLRRREESGWRQEQRRLLIILALVALAVIFLGFAMYLPTQAKVRASTWRVFMLSSIGGGLLLVAILRLLCRPLRSWSVRAFAVGVGVLSAICTAHLLAQHRVFAEISENQQRMLAGILREAPGLGEDVRLILIFDEAGNAISGAVFSYGRYLGAALRSVYGMESLNAHVCYPFVLWRGERCELDADSVTVVHSNERWEVPYREVLAFERDREGRISILERIPEWLSLQPEVRGYQPGELLKRAGGRQAMRPGLVALPPIPSRPEAASGRGRPSTEVNLEFDTEGKLLGAGWGVARGKPPGLTYRFMPHHRAAVHFGLPVRDYRLEFRIANAISPEVLDSLRLSISGQEVVIKRETPGVFRGEVSAALIAPAGDTTLFFAVDPRALEQVQEKKGPLVGLGFDWLRLTPVR